MALHGGGDIRPMCDQPDLNISKLRRLSEIGRTDERLLAVDDDALRMEAGARRVALVQADAISLAAGSTKRIIEANGGVLASLIRYGGRTDAHRYAGRPRQDRRACPRNPRSRYE